MTTVCKPTQASVCWIESGVRGVTRDPTAPEVRGVTRDPTALCHHFSGSKRLVQRYGAHYGVSRVTSPRGVTRDPTIPEVRGVTRDPPFKEKKLKA